MLQGYEETVRSLVAGGKTVVMAVPIPTYDFDVTERLGMHHALGRDPKSLGMPRQVFEETIAPIRRFFMGLAEKYPTTLVFDPTDKMCDETMCLTYDEQTGSRYFDKGHVSLSGAHMLVGPLRSVIKTGINGGRRRDCEPTARGATLCSGETPEGVPLSRVRS